MRSPPGPNLSIQRVGKEEVMRDEHDTDEHLCPRDKVVHPLRTHLAFTAKVVGQRALRDRLIFLISSSSIALVASWMVHHVSGQYKRSGSNPWLPPPILRGVGVWCFQWSTNCFYQRVRAPSSTPPPTAFHVGQLTSWHGQLDALTSMFWKYNTLRIATLFQWA